MNNAQKEFTQVSRDELYQVLIQEVNLYRKLASVMREMQDAIVKGDVERIQMVTAREQGLVKKSNALTELRYAMLEKIYLEEGILQRPITLHNLIVHSGHDFDAAWTAVDCQLHDVVREIQNLNQENKRLLEVSLGFVREIIHRIYSVREKEQGDVYDRDGSLSRKSKNAKHLDVNI
jgi:flagellar biosynthesis/type III secretory pathway chaperone